MRIAEIAPLYVAVPPEGYGGTERCIAVLTDELVRLGHDVTLFASGDSTTSAQLVASTPLALGFDSRIDAAACHLAALKMIYQNPDRFDIFHAHTGLLTLPFTPLSRTPTVLTLHSRLDRRGRAQALQAFIEPNYVAVSHAQRSAVPEVNWARTIYNGVLVEEFPFCSAPGTYLAFVGRMSPEKGIERAIAVARLAGVPLKIAARIEDEGYFEQVIVPQLQDPLVEYLGILNEQEKRALLCGALALLLPINWPEPFGMVFIEAMACGAPVLTCPHGAAPEIVVDGKTGFLRATVEGLAAAVEDVRYLSRTACREYVRNHFHGHRMVTEYVELFEDVQALSR